MRMPLAVRLASVFVLMATCAGAQVSFDQAVGGLSASDAKVRLRSATLLKDSPHVEAAVPLAKAVSDTDNAVQLEAIAAELNIFVVGKGEPAKRLGFITIEDRNRAAAQNAFDAGPLALAATPVPPQVLLALRSATRSNSPKVAVEALYAFGALGAQPAGAARQDLLQASAPDLMAVLNLPDKAIRLAAIHVVGRLYEKRAGDPAVDQRLSNLVIAAVNESDVVIKRAAMDALGNVRDTRAIDGLTQLFQFYGKGELAEGALTALSRIGHRTSAQLFLTQMASKSPVFKTLAIEGLARTGDASHMAAIQGALKRETDERVVGASEFAAAMLSNAPIERIVNALNRPKLHDAARQYLIEVSPGRIMRLSRYAQDPTPRLRIDIADIAGMAGDPQGVAVVAPLLTDPDKQVALAAERATLRLKSDR